MTATLATLPTDIILSISAFLNNPLDLLSLSQVCRTARIFSLRLTNIRLRGREDLPFRVPCISSVGIILVQIGASSTPVASSTMA